MATYRKKPVEIEALGPLTAENSAEIAEWSGGLERPAEGPASKYSPITYDGSLFIPTLEGMMTAKLGDYIIRGVQGEFYPCKPDIFVATYDAV
ncbi:hypothetical protein [Rathayibacter sp. VKM Ac-2630]|uniref:hypothetical protein n=1 Tax=Rathayibacter sp. VKM Ac-2630 TaxID=1938617 RepID=UPI000981B787|nr:hypothetical protein [Rathayibacter sp. VKM Ac-2630]OOB91200.1 hypothetical protein B0T42_07325 [Rathayibacter sp. VKM Ac-2630]